MLFATSATLSLRNALGIPSIKLPIDNTNFASYVLPPLVCSYIVARLVILPQTRTFRIALLPLVVLLAVRAALSVDCSRGKHELAFLNVDLVLGMFSIVIRAVDWTFLKRPLVRHFRPANSTPSSVMDALDLSSNLRGLGWDWSRGLYIPRERRPTTRFAFVFSTLLSAVVHTLICGAFHRAILTLAPMGVGPVQAGSTIFDETLPFPLRYFRASVISIFTALAIYAVLQMNYDLVTIPAVLFLGQDTAQWPPVFDAPWSATSLSDFWGRRWHQLFRRNFLVLGGYPLSYVLGDVGIVLGAFLASGVTHYSAMVTLNPLAEPRWMLAGFGMMGPGVLLERAFYRLTGRKVGGLAGRVWTMGWLLVWGNVIVEGFARAGMFACAGNVDSVSPVKIPLERLAAALDAWLHTI